MEWDTCRHHSRDDRVVQSSWIAAGTEPFCTAVGRAGDSREFCLSRAVEMAVDKLRARRLAWTEISRRGLLISGNYLVEKRPGATAMAIWGPASDAQ
jgi:hypothetical protein